MKVRQGVMVLGASLLMPGLAGAEVMRSETMEAELNRRAVTMTSTEGKSIRAEQVLVTMRRLDGQPIGAGDVESYVRFAERAACQGREVMVSVVVGASDGAGQYDVLCAAGG